MKTNFIPKNIFPLLKKSILGRELCACINDNHFNLNIKNACGSYPSLITSFLFKEFNLPVLMLFADKEEAAYALDEVEDIFGKENVLFYPSSYLTPYQTEEVQNANVVLRTEVINQLSKNGSPKYIVSYAEAIFEKIINNKNLSELSQSIKVGDKIDTNFLNEVLFSYKFIRTILLLSRENFL